MNWHGKLPYINGIYWKILIVYDRAVTIKEVFMVIWRRDCLSQFEFVSHYWMERKLLYSAIEITYSPEINFICLHQIPRVPTLSVRNGWKFIRKPTLASWTHYLHTKSRPNSALGQILVQKGTSPSVMLLWTAVVAAHTTLFGVFMWTGLLIGWC